MKRTLTSLQETIEIGRKIGSLLRAGDVIALNGPLGVGKTALVGGIAAGMGIDPGFSVTSPTFVFAHVYEGRIPLYHVDLYRVEEASELPGLGLDDMMGGDGIAVVEWFERFPILWDGDRIQVEMAFGEKKDRLMTLVGVGPRGTFLAESLAESE